MELLQKGCVLLLRAYCFLLLLVLLPYSQKNFGTILRKTSNEATKLALYVHIASIAFVYPLYGYTKALVSRFRWGNAP